MKTRIIAVTELRNGVHSKFARRLEHVKGTLIPSLQRIGQQPEIFPAIIGCEVPVIRGLVHHDGLSIKVGSGCIGNLLSNYELWRLSATSGHAVLVLEDDAILPESHALHVERAIGAFLQAQTGEPDILYLLSQSPSVKDSPKKYAPGEVQPIDEHTSRLIRTQDLSCTAAYMVTPPAAAGLMARIDKRPTMPTDGFVHTALMEGSIGVVVQAEPTRGFMLNDNWAEWNHKHDPALIP